MANMIHTATVLAYMLLCIWLLKYYLAKTAQFAKSRNQSNIMLECVMSLFLILAFWLGMAMPAGVMAVMNLLIWDMNRHSWIVQGWSPLAMEAIGFGLMLFIAVKQLFALGTVLETHEPD